MGSRVLITAGWYNTITVGYCTNLTSMYDRKSQFAIKATLTTACGSHDACINRHIVLVCATPIINVLDKTL